MISAGIIGGLLASVFGFIDWMHIPGKTRAARLGMWHGIGNFVVLGAFIASWEWQRRAPGFEPDLVALLLAWGAVALSGVAAWLGAELVHRMGVSVDQGAHLNAPSSLEQPRLSKTPPINQEQPRERAVGE